MSEREPQKSGKPIGPDYVIDRQKHMLRSLAEPAGGLTIKAQINKVRRVLGWKVRRIERLWYGEAPARTEEFLTLHRKVTELERRSRDRKERLHELEELVASTLPPG